MIPLAPGYDARMSMAWLRALAVIVAVAGALLLLASGAGVRLALWTYGTGFALLRYAAYIGIAAAMLALVALFLPQGRTRWIAALLDRKSTRLNSSHSQISYAVFCLKKKKHRYN